MPGWHHAGTKSTGSECHFAMAAPVFWAESFNFSRRHRFQNRVSNTGLTLQLHGFDHDRGIITDPLGALRLVSDDSETAAEWSFEGLMSHWQRKHAQAVYVPSLMRKNPSQQYKFGHTIRLGIGTDFLRFLKAVAVGAVYYDPGIKLENVSERPRLKRRSQFRVSSAHLSSLYGCMETVTL